MIFDGFWPYREMARQFLVSVFAPEGWPSSVAPEYGRYQLWDTIQQAPSEQGWRLSSALRCLLIEITITIINIIIIVYYHIFIIIYFYCYD